ncbi:aspartyl protease family protein, partial [Escherichia coli]|uniref:aspartyl protease family protein n=1 Tax=Escherichia coli TaxID=562 RepID=UPI001412B44B
GRAYELGAVEARNDPNVVMGTFLVNGHFATVLFDSGADYSFISTDFVPLLNVEPSHSNACYEIEIANGELVKLNKLLRDCTLVLNDHPF